MGLPKMVDGCREVTDRMRWDRACAIAMRIHRAKKQ